MSGHIATNLISACAIGVIIAAMAATKNKQLRATIYSLPLPITIALIATNGKITASNVFGLALLCGFLWLVYYLHYIRKLSILLSDIVAAVLYILVGYVIVKTTNLPIELVMVVYVVAWVSLVYLLSRRTLHESAHNYPAKLSPAAKGTVTAVLSFGLLSLKDALAGIVVTFPFSGVFAVVEARAHLATLASVFTRNSIAILALFFTVYMLQNHLSLLPRIAFGWIVYLAILSIVQRIPVGKQAA